MEKTFSKIEISVIKSAAKSAAPFVAKKQKLEAQIKEVEEKVAEQIRLRVKEKIEKLEAEKASYQSIIDSLNEPVKKITGGYTAEDLITIEKVGSGKIDEKTGKEGTLTKYTLKYPDTIIPPSDAAPEGTEAPADEAEAPADNTEAPAEEAAGEAGEEQQKPEEMPDELQQEAAEAAQAAHDADPFADNDPFAGQ